MWSRCVNHMSHFLKEQYSIVVNARHLGGMAQDTLVVGSDLVILSRLDLGPMRVYCYSSFTTTLIILGNYFSTKAHFNIYQPLWARWARLC